ncbi:MAG: selenocysteine-specific translation elongation factor [Gemmatimonadota bacterium]|nr:MAG: selenocysteine-specific translation elongation factor [Gemmatimonadota bacterium]
MKSVILGTAGHVDHGKTALIEALTGTNTDRWEEERQRGITIDLGFASFPTGDDELEVSVVDVPGHEDFVKNMLAGATGVDLLLLVVAADEGPMPQTAEHLWIARLLGVERGVVAVSKVDLVDSEWRDLVCESAAQELERVVGAKDWPVVPVSAVTREGLDELRAAILEAARGTPARGDDDLFRLPVDRSFSVRGVGTVVTGTVWSGRVKVGDEIRVLPEGQAARVRGLQVHGRDVGFARAGQRAAVALVGLERSQVGRGDTIVADPVWEVTRYLDARLYVVPDSPWPLRHWQRLRLHLGTAETMARLVLYGRQRLPPGASALVQLRLERPVVARAADRFVIRFYSPVTTIGGGVVVDPWARRRGRLTPEAETQLSALAEAEGSERLRLVVSASDQGATCEELAVRAGMRPARLAADVRALEAQGAVRQLRGRWFSEQALRNARGKLLEMLAGGHARDAGARGLSLESLRSAAAGPAGLVDAALADLEREGLIRVEGSLAALAEHVPKLDPARQAMAEAARRLIVEAKLAPPTVKELAAELGAREDAVLAVLKFLAERAELVAVTADLYFDPGAVAEAQTRVGRVLSGGRPAAPSLLREALGVSRKYVIPLLEYLDTSGFTRRTREGRVLMEGP